MTEYPISFEMDDYQLFKKFLLFTIFSKRPKDLLDRPTAQILSTGIAYSFKIYARLLKYVI